MKTPYKNSGAFSLIEILVALSILAIIAGLLVPKYMQISRAANIQVAAQQVDTVRKAVLAWLAAQSSVSAGSTAYDNGGSGATAGYPSGSGSVSAGFTGAWSQIVSYLDSNFVSQLKVVSAANNVIYFTTPQMQAITGGTLNISSPVTTSLPNGCPAVTTIDAAQTSSAAAHTACGVIYWPTNAQVTGSRISGQPLGILYYKQ
jgi:prepilin-type N-terminal cleavage/methylation domain-containing protein